MYNIYPNRRVIKSRHVTAHLMHILHNILPTNSDFRMINREIEEFFYSQGIDFITEADRVAAGLQPRDHNGLTIDELRAIDARYLQDLLKPIATIVPKDFDI